MALSPRDLNKHGKEFEKLCDSAFGPLETKFPIIWERILDSASVGNVIRTAEGDFRLRVRSPDQGQIFEFLIECKASVVENSFNRCFRSLIKPDQLPLMRKHRRAGVVCIYLFQAVNNKEIEIWTLKQLKDAYYEKRKAFTDEPRYIMDQGNLKKFAERLVSNPKGFITSVLGDSI